MWVKKHSGSFKFYFPSVLKNKIDICSKLSGSLAKVLGSRVINMALRVFYYYYSLQRKQIFLSSSLSKSENLSENRPLSSAQLWRNLKSHQINYNISIFVLKNTQSSVFIVSTTNKIKTTKRYYDVLKL